MDLIAGFRVFVRVAESLSFSAVAREMGVTQPAVSRQVSALEEHLGARLLERTTRNLALTEDGRDLLGHARAVLEAVERAEGAVGRHHAGPAGLVRIGAGITFGRVAIAPRLGRLLERHPNLQIDLRLSDSQFDLVHDGVDVAIRVGPIAETTLVARRVGAVSRIVVGAKSYIERHPAPETPEDLKSHECIMLDRLVHSNVWRLEREGVLREVHVAGRFRTDSPDAVRAAVNSGLGLGLVSEWLMQEELETGAVRVALPGWRSPADPVHAVYLGGRNLAPRTRAVIDFLVEEFRSNPAISGLRDRG